MPEDSLDYAMKSVSSSGFGQTSPADSFKSIAEFTNNWFKEISEKYNYEDYGSVFEL